MNLLNFKLAYKRINRIVWPEAKQIAWRTWLWLKKVGGESCVKLFFSYVVRDILRDFILSLLDQMK